MSVLTLVTRSQKVLSPANMAVCGISLALSFCIFSAFGGSVLVSKVLVLAGAGVVLLLYPEFALAAFLVVGDVKGDDRISALLPFDLTLAIGAILIAGIALNLLRKKRAASMPPIYFLFVLLVAMMIVSLTYTPVLTAGIEKLELFTTITTLAIVAPFFVLPDLHAMKRFLWFLGGAAFAICLASLSGLGGASRLVTPSDNTIGLGRIGSVLAAMIWFTAVPGSRLRYRLVAYAAMSVPVIAMIGSGSRGSAIAFVLLILATVFFSRRLALDVVALSIVGLAALPFIDIPQTSFRYLGSLFSAQSVGGLLDFRADLLEYGWQLLKQHPLLGVGIGGFRYASPNPGVYKWPHDIFIELACELGIPAAFIGFAIFGAAVRESIRQLRDTSSAEHRLSMIVAGLLWIGLVAAVTTGNINSDRSIWLFISFVFVIQAYQSQTRKRFGLAKEMAGRPLASAHV
ncbi:MAG: O-antigen ligase family protein [Candidatus Acidiferrales bacterium]